MIFWFKQLGLSKFIIFIVLNIVGNKVFAQSGLRTNEEFINGLQCESELDVDNMIAVFEYVFNQLGDTLNVYPSENYYYFEFVFDKIEFQGNIGLFRELIDKGEINFGYYPKSLYSNSDSTYISLDSKLGLTIVNKSNFETKLTFNGVSKTFLFNQLDFSIINDYPKTNDEEVVCPVFDESGYSFVLMYQKTKNVFFWCLDESIMLDSLIEVDENIFVGVRSDFVFYHDSENNRKILLSVNDENVKRNNWYDGPFDQIPDNHIKNQDFNFVKYLNKVFPDDEFTPYGGFIDDAEVRIGIGSYLAITSLDELSEIIQSLEPKTLDDYLQITRLIIKE